MPKIQRLSANLRRQAGIDFHASRNMHVVNENNINMPLPNQKYTINQENGLIRRITLYEHALKEEILEKVADGFKTIKSRFIK